MSVALFHIDTCEQAIDFAERVINNNYWKSQGSPEAASRIQRAFSIIETGRSLINLHYLSRTRPQSIEAIEGVLTHLIVEISDMARAAIEDRTLTTENYDFTILTDVRAADTAIRAKLPRAA